ncbi:hypothetical protein [Inconstantimicrobium mannanitabidum]|uniref:hypothetical protein n=1 Tax=Inconstantimicrobium mannanitabidum TaxID=1604901 RepID=UPI0021C38FFB|nr:hypothetical protein [Clostridium sp. TW13]
MSERVDICEITEEYISHKYVKNLMHELAEDVLHYLCIYPLVAFFNRALTGNSSMTYLGLMLLIPILIMTCFRVKIARKSKFLLGVLGVFLVSTLILILSKQYLFEILLLLWTYICFNKSSKVQYFKFTMGKVFQYEFGLMFQILLPAVFGLDDIQNLTLIVAILIMLVGITYVCKARNTKLFLITKEGKGYKNKNGNIFLIQIAALIIISMISLFGLGVFENAHYITQDLAKGAMTIWQRANPNDTSSNNAKKKNEVPKLNLAKIDINKYAGKQSKVFLVLGYIFSFLFKVIAILILLAISYMVLNGFLLYIKKFMNDEKVTFVFDKVDNGEDTKKAVKERKRILPTFRPDEKGKVRRAYRNRILKYRKKNVFINEFYTANEIRQEIFNTTADNLDKITAIYEKARYSNNKVTKEEIEIIKGSK